MTTKHFALAFLTIGVTVAAAAGPEASPGDQGRMEGREGSHRRQGERGRDVGHLVTFTHEHFAIREKGKMIYKGTYTLDRTAKPPTIDFKHDGGKLEGKTWLGLYRRDGDKLTICDNAPDLAKGRPTTLDSKAGSGRALVSLERVKKK